MAYKQKRRKKTARKSSARKSSSKRAYSRRRSSTKRKSSAKSGRSRGQTIRLVIEQAPVESSLDFGKGRPTRKAMF